MRATEPAQAIAQNPVAGSVCVDKLKLLLQEKLEVTVAPLGCLRITVTQLIVLFVM